MGKAGKVGDAEQGGLTQPLVPAGEKKTAKRSSKYEKSGALSSFRLHKRYWENVRLALCVSAWVVIFSAPTYSKTAYEWMFGVQDGTEAGPCGRAGLGNTDADTYCGWVPFSYFAYWPNVVQMIVFTVFATTGNTVQLAAQGVLGTLVACILYFSMLTVFPNGASPSEDGNAYNAPVAWLYFIGGTFMFLLSTAPENSIKFGLSWHVVFAMAFMNPSKDPQSRHGYMSGGFWNIHWDAEIMVVMMTSVAGATIAIIGTLFPVPLLNITRIDDDAVQLQQEMQKIWSDAIGYFCGSKQTSKHYAIESKIDGVSPLVTRIKANLGITWWETFDIGYSGSARTLFVAYANLVEGMDDVLFSLKTAIHGEDFTGQHYEFCQALKPCMESLKDRACELMLLCANACMDGHISKEEETELATKRAHVLEAQKALLQTYNQLCERDSHKFPYISKDLANESVFIFALSAWARSISDFSDNVDDIYRAQCGGGIASFFKKTFGGLCGEICGLYAPSGMTRDHLIFVLRNSISITICFVIGMYSDSSVFTPFSGTMASTCCLLISKFSGSAFQKNLQRLLGLALGKVLPLLVMASLGVFTAWGTEFLSFAHAFMILLYMFVFIYMSMTTSQWSAVGGIVAGFGCYGLLQTPIEGGNDEMYAGLYKEIGQVTFAIIVQLVVDASFMMPSPRDIALGHIDGMKKEYLEAFESFFGGDLKTMQTEALDMRDSWLTAMSVAPETDPKLVVVPGKRIAFKHTLYIEVLSIMKVLRSDFKMLVIAMKDWKAPPSPTSGDDKACVKNEIMNAKEVSSLLDVVKKLKCMGPIKGQILDHLKVTLNVWDQIMTHDSEDIVQTPDLKRLVEDYGPGDSVVDVDDLVKEINTSPEIKAEVDKVKGERANMTELTSDRRVRLTVGLRALERAVEHLVLMDALLLKEHIF